MTTTDRFHWIRPGWYLAICEGCTPVLPQPFRDPDERDRWSADHAAATGHIVTNVDPADSAPR